MSTILCMHEAPLGACPDCAPAANRSRLIDPSTGVPFELLRKFPRAEIERRAFDVSNENLKTVYPMMPRRERRKRARREAKKLVESWGAAEA